MEYPFFVTTTKNVGVLNVYTYICRMKIEEEIQQKKFSSVHQKMHINIQFTASWLSQLSLGLLKPYNLSIQQFNILRILRGLHPQPASVKLLTERMVDRMSNASRLVEKLRQKGLVERKPCPNDRRRVEVGITAQGLQVLEETSKVIEVEMVNLTQNLSADEAEQLSDLLDKLRG